MKAGNIPLDEPDVAAVAPARWMTFLGVVAQFSLLVLLIEQWDIKGRSVTRVMQLALAGFIIHHFLPLRFRLRFFSFLSIAATMLVLGNVGSGKVLGVFTGQTGIGELLYLLFPGALLVVVGLTLIAICHLPLNFGLRILLLCAAATGLALARANANWFPDVPVAVWVILGSMFVFRIMLYLYDLKHRAAPFTPARACSYFFMLPNVCFPLFPIVDYKTFCSTYYNEDWPRIYQTGLQWMLRGVFQLLLYQVIYQFAPLDVAGLTSTLDVAAFILCTYLLYLHVSGQFHLIVGLLHMFGFNLPETHHLFLLASSFTDFWRRINIYWKDFVMKLFFYPAFFSLRKHGTLPAMAVATLLTFFFTWLLHSWQWFWIRGSFLFTWQDISFWVILALLVLANALYEATSSRHRRLSSSQVAWRDNVSLGLKTVATFTAICLLWTLWSAQSLDELKTLADAARHPLWYEVALISLFLVLIGIAGMVWGRSTRESSEGKTAPAQAPFRFWPSAVSAAAVMVLLLALPGLASKMSPAADLAFARLRHDALNPRDLDQQRRGYYEELDAARADNRNQLKVQEPDGWNKGTEVMYRDRSDFLRAEIVPSASGVLSGVLATSNRLGMRDREYSASKPPATHRVVLMGSSHELGVGVKDHETFENLVEDRLNQLRDASAPRWEILNMSVAGNSVLQKMLRLEQTGFSYQPDTVMFVVNPFEWHFVVESIKTSLVQGLTPPPDYQMLVDGISRQAGVDPKMPGLMIERRVRPLVDEVYAWVFQRLARQCALHGARPLVVYRPATIDLDGSEAAGRNELIRLARAAGIEVLDLSPAFASVRDRSTLVLARWDDHTTALGHRLLAETLYQRFLPFAKRVGESQFSGN